MSHLTTLFFFSGSFFPRQEIPWDFWDAGKGQDWGQLLPLSGREEKDGQAAAWEIWEISIHLQSAAALSLRFGSPNFIQLSLHKANILNLKPVSGNDLLISDRQ